MAGWALFAAVALLSLAALWRLQCPMRLRSLALAGVAVAAAGYAWHVRAARVEAITADRPIAPALDAETLSLRNAMFGRFGATATYFIISDGLLRSGAPGAAARFVQAGIGREPGNMALWTQLGILISARDKTMSPAAAFAFRRAIAVAPGEPAPVFFLGLAYVRAGEFARGRAAWAHALALTPPDFPYRPAIVARLALLDAYLAKRGR